MKKCTILKFQNDFLKDKTKSKHFKLQETEIIIASEAKIISSERNRNLSQTLSFEMTQNPKK